MTFQDLIKARQSVRKFSDEPIKEEDILKCVEAARLAPSATNSQPWRFVLVDEPDKMNNIAKATFNSVIRFNKFTLRAKALIVVVAKKGNSSSKIGQMITGLPYYLLDVGMAAEHFCLQAAELGIGTCMIGWFNEKKIKKHVTLESNERVVLVIALGYPKDTIVHEKKRKTIEQIYSRNK
ncbi:nitroreductase family protein [Clostridiaceae bacterium M8S5]|nr:nitroreductase family protein [Clostridiaceae bacterium M8S5]